AAGGEVRMGLARMRRCEVDCRGRPRSPGKEAAPPWGPPHPPSALHPPLRRALLVACVVLFAVVAHRYSLKAQAGRSAFCRWRPQLLQLQHGVDLAARFNYPNP